MNTPNKDTGKPRAVATILRLAVDSGYYPAKLGEPKSTNYMCIALIRMIGDGITAKECSKAADAIREFTSSHVHHTSTMVSVLVRVNKAIAADETKRVAISKRIYRNWNKREQILDSIRVEK